VIITSICKTLACLTILGAASPSSAHDQDSGKSVAEQKTVAHEKEQKKPMFYVSGLIGAGVPTEDLTSGRVTFGGALGVNPRKDFGVGVYFTTSSETIVLSSGTVFIRGNDRISLYGVEAQRNWLNIVEGFWTGAKIGLVSESASAQASTGTGSAFASGSETSFSLGPKIGYDHQIVSYFSAGVQADAINVFADANFWVFNFMAVLKLWV
jgi:hypothetical protein